MGVVGRLDQYASMLAGEFDEYSMSENLLTYSQQFDNTSSWTTNGVIVTPNATTAPDGTLTAELMTEDSATNSHWITYATAPYTTNTYTFSIFAKQAVGSRYLRFTGFGLSAVSENAIFDISSGIVYSPSTTTIFKSASIIPYPNGWYRCICNIQYSGTGQRPFFGMTDSTTNFGSYSYTGNGTSGFYIWGVQLEYGSTATGYTPTITTAINRVLVSTTNTNITGLGTYYSSGFDENTSITTLVQTGENLITYSTYNASTWSNIFPANATLTTGISAPDGTNTAVRLTCTATGNSLLRVTFPGFTPNGTDTYTTSFYVKLISGTTSSSNLLTTDLADGNPTGNYLPNLITNQWVRVSFSGVPTASTKSFIDLLSDNTNNYVLDFWGVQVERGSVATDYIPTTGVSRSRSLPSSTFALSANVFAPYDPVYDQFSGTLFGAGQGRYMRQNTDKSVIVYNEIDEITDFRDIVRTGLILDIDAGMNSSFNNTGTTWIDLSNNRSSVVAVGQQAYTTAGTYTFTVPTGCTSISAVVVGGGGGGGGCDGQQVRGETNGGGAGGGLAYGTIAVTPGETLTITVGVGGTAGGSDGDGTNGGTSTIVRSAITLLSGGGGTGGTYRNNPPTTPPGGASGGTLRIGGGSGGAGGTQSANAGATGGGGAGGYSGNGGAGGAYNAAGSASTGAGGGGGGGFGGSNDTLRAGGGGGVGIKGTGSNGSGGVINGGGGGGGSALVSVTEGTSGGGNSSGLGGTYGGGGGGKADCFTASGTATPNGGAGTNGAVRIVWGTDRSYPSTGLTDFTPVVGYDNVSHTAQLINAPTYSSANGGYLVFNGTNQYVTSIFRTTSGQAVTYCGWLYSTETTATYRNFVDSVSANPMMWWNTTGQIEFDAGLYTTTAVYRNQWVYVALSKPSGNSSPSYYVNGVLVGTGSAYTTPAATPTWFNRAGAQTWKGNASNVQAYNRELAAAEILQNYNALKHRFGL